MLAVLPSYINSYDNTIYLSQALLQAAKKHAII